MLHQNMHYIKKEGKRKKKLPTIQILLILSIGTKCYRHMGTYKCLGSGGQAESLTRAVLENVTEEKLLLGKCIHHVDGFFKS